MASAQVSIHRRNDARGDVTTNSVEGISACSNAACVGISQHVSEQHLKRNLADFDFKQSNRTKLGINDTMRAGLMLKGAEGKRLTYRRVN